MLQNIISQISTYLSKLSERDKKILVVILILVTITMFDRLFIVPTMSRLTALDDEILKEQEMIKRDVHFLSYKNKILKEGRAVNPYFTENLLSDDEVIAAFLKKIEMISSKADVVVAKVTPTAGQQDGNYLKYTADLECSGTFNNVITFMHLINTSDELTKVVKYNLVSKKSDSDELKATMTIAKVIVTKKGINNPANPASANTQADVSNSKNK